MSNIAVVDKISFVRQCVANSIRDPDTVVEEFASADKVQGKFDMILYHNESLEEEMIHDLPKLQEHGHVVVFGSTTNSYIVSIAIQHGVRGYIPTGKMKVEEVKNILQFVLNGGIFIPTDVLTPNAVEHDPNGLTDREVLILDQLRIGKQNKVIAYELGLSESTVKVHIRHILTKLKVRNRTEAVSVSLKQDYTKKANGAVITNQLTSTQVSSITPEL